MNLDIVKSMLVVLLAVFFIIVLGYQLKESSNFAKFDMYTPFAKNIDNPNQYEFSKIKNDVPTIYVSEASYPFASKMVEAIIDKDSYNKNLKHVSTQYAYQVIIDNVADFSIASETSTKQKAVIDSLSGDIKLVPIAKEALILFTNSENVVDNLSISDIKKIYNLEIQNWNELSGNDFKISPYQLKKDVGGSEKVFSIVIGDSLSSTHSKFIAYDMKNIIDKVASDKGGIGYAFNLFYSEFYIGNFVKKIKVEGIEANYENIESGTYPLMGNIYFIYRESNTNPNIKLILDWLLSKDGQKFIKEAGYQPINP